MLGWLRSRAAPAADARSRDGQAPPHRAEGRLGKLLDRLGSESQTTTAAAEARVVAASPGAEVASEPANEMASSPTTDRGAEYVEGVDPEDYRDALPLLRRVMVAVGGKPEDDSEMLAAKIVDALREKHGFTADLLSEINPYLEQFVRDVHSGVVEFDAEEAPAAVSRITGPAAAENTASDAPAAEAMPPTASENIAPDLPVSEEARGIAPPAKARRRTAKGCPGGTVTIGDAGGPSPGMRIIAVCNQKGGTGKTTIAAHLAVRAGERAHGPIVLIDTDPQGSLGRWWRARHADTPALVQATPEELAAHLAEQRTRSAALAIIDTPPMLTGTIEQVIALADLVLIPVRPSPLDLRAVGATVEMAQRAGKPFVFVVNGAVPRAGITEQAVAVLSEQGRVAPVVLCQRTDFAASMADGRTAVETAAGGQSAQEIDALWQCVREQIGMRTAA